MRVRLGSLAGPLRDRDALPPELLDGDKRLFQMSVLGDEVGSEMKREALGDKDMRGCLREDYRMERSGISLDQWRRKLVQ